MNFKLAKYIINNITDENSWNRQIYYNQTSNETEVLIDGKMHVVSLLHSRFMNKNEFYYNYECLLKDWIEEQIDLIQY